MTNAIANQVFSGFTNPSVIDQTSAFNGCDFILINALGVGTDGFEIAAAVVIDVVADVKLLGGLVEVPQVAIAQKELPLDVQFFDTGIIVPLPFEATRSNCECKVCISTSYAVNLEIYAVSKKALCDCGVELKRIQDVVDYLRLINTAIAINQIAQDAAFLTIATTVSLALAPVTAGASLALPGVVGSALSAGTSAIAPVLLGAGFLLPV